jgi:hypothetical protein
MKKPGLTREHYIRLERPHKDEHVHIFGLILSYEEKVLKDTLEGGE